MTARARHIALAVLLAAIAALASLNASAQRRVTPINTPQTATQPINELANDTARINARMRASMAHYHDENGNIVYVDTITGREWRDSSAIKAEKKKMAYPLIHAAAVGVDVWNPVMRAFGQKYGLVDFSAQLSMHNRYIALVETGVGMADNTPPANNFTYKTPLSWYIKLGADYNFLYNADTPDYQFLAGLRFGVAPFTFNVTGITIDPGYWGEAAHPAIPSQQVTVGWFELALGLRVKLWGPISAGWTFRFHSILAESKTPYGQPWYIPGYGSRHGAITGSFSFFYTLPLSKAPKPE